MTVNLFQYWVIRRKLATLAHLLDVPSRNIETVDFEACFPVCDDWRRYGFTEPPHLDFALSYADGSRIGIECKLFEPYGRADHIPLKTAYLELPDAWVDIPACRALQISSPPGVQDITRWEQASC